jgi:chemotaxis protein CheC
MAKIKLSAFEKDILGEIGTMCVGNATTALALILGRRIDLDLPNATVVNKDKIPDMLRMSPEEPVIGIHMQILGNARGNALMIFSRKEASLLVDLLIGMPQLNVANLTEIGISALKEVGNIVVSSYLSALSAFTGISAFPSTVTLSSGSARSLVSMGFWGLQPEDCDETILVEAVFKDTRKDLGGNFFIIFDATSISMILKKAKNLIR